MQLSEDRIGLRREPICILLVARGSAQQQLAEDEKKEKVSATRLSYKVLAKSKATEIKDDDTIAEQDLGEELDARKSIRLVMRLYSR